MGKAWKIFLSLQPVLGAVHVHLFSKPRNVKNPWKRR